MIIDTDNHDRPVAVQHPVPEKKDDDKKPAHCFGNWTVPAECHIKGFSSHKFGE